MNNDIFSAERLIRKDKIVKALAASDAEAILISDNSNIYYTTGRVINGYTFINRDGVELFFVRRPVGLSGEGIVYIRKPENIVEHLSALNIAVPQSLALELDTLSYSDTQRLSAAMQSPRMVNGSVLMRRVRSVKTPFEIEKLKESGVRH
ncbi:MAG: aminopeptidase P family N-terminal domain-containing protein, partial [Muribaculaceae bacterium]|nr:aminopeptidase P family N-terminal domain-containing protein [Muribaculaceae bacterium]